MWAFWGSVSGGSEYGYLLGSFCCLAMRSAVSVLPILRLRERMGPEFRDFVGFRRRPVICAGIVLCVS